ncbi:MAG: hypothetical protein WAR79_11665 [Melioribacteraceae bacterium]
MQFLKDCFVKSKIDLIRNDKFRFAFCNYTIAIYLTTFSFLLLNCSEQKSIDINTLSKVYVDLLVVEDFYMGTDSLKIKKAEVFNKYEIDTSSYFNSYRALQYDSEKWNEFFNLSQTYLDTLKASQKK